MSLDIKIKDGHGSGSAVRVNEYGDLIIAAQPYPPIGAEVVLQPVRQFFKTDAGASDMRVNGSVTNQKFYIRAVQGYDTYIKVASVVIADASSSLNKFGNITALTNGVLFEYVSDDLGRVTIHDALKTNFNFVRLALGNPAFGATTNSFLASNVSSTSEAYLPVIDFTNIFGVPFGLKLRADSADRLVFTIRDDVSTIDQFDCIAYGFKRAVR